MKERISVEFVPRSEEGLREDLKSLKQSVFAEKISLINIPDLLRFEMRSWQGASLSQKFFETSMPHIRAMDIDLNKELPFKKFFIENNIREALIIEGDPPQEMRHETFPTVTTDVLRKFKEELPNVKLYAGIDPYRSSLRDEKIRTQRKLQAGAVGFFTQPFFDMRFLKIYADMLDSLGVKSEEIYWGLSPVVSKPSQSYWERKNCVIFPKNFAPTLEWNVEFAREVVAFSAENHNSLYFMPIKGNLLAYLAGIFSL